MIYQIADGQDSITPETLRNMMMKKKKSGLSQLNDGSCAQPLHYVEECWHKKFDE